MVSKLLSLLSPSLLAEKLTELIPNLFGAFVIAIVFWGIGRVVKRTVGTALEKSNVAEDVRKLLLRFLRYIVAIVALLTIASQLGFNIGALVAGLGILGLAFSFASQDTVQNIISGVSIIIDRPFGQGDWISMGPLHATVTDIRLRTTVLTSFDNETIVVPNKDLVQERIINYTLTPKIRVKVPVGIAYKENIQSARDTILSTLQGHGRIMKEPAPAVIVTELGGSSVNLELRFWTEDSPLKFPLQFEYTEKIKKALDAADIEIPFPHLQLFLEDSAGLGRLSGGPHS
jgi:small conductance mechanosensitive channel